MAARLGRTIAMGAAILAMAMSVAACGGAGGAEVDPELPESPPFTDLADTGLGEEPPAPAPALELAGDARLEVGSEGEEVRTLQEILERLGFDPEGIDGIFGPNTRDALVAFQRDRGLAPSGVVDQETAEALNAAVAESSQG